MSEPSKPRVTCGAHYCASGAAFFAFQVIRKKAYPKVQRLQGKLRWDCKGAQLKTTMIPKKAVRKWVGISLTCRSRTTWVKIGPGDGLKYATAIVNRHTLIHSAADATRWDTTRMASVIVHTCAHFLLLSCPLIIRFKPEFMSHRKYTGWLSIMKTHTGTAACH